MDDGYVWHGLPLLHLWRAGDLGRGTIRGTDGGPTWDRQRQGQSRAARRERNAQVSLLRVVGRHEARRRWPASPAALGVEWGQLVTAGERLRLYRFHDLEPRRIARDHLLGNRRRALDSRVASGVADGHNDGHGASLAAGRTTATHRDALGDEPPRCRSPCASAAACSSTSGARAVQTSAAYLRRRVEGQATEYCRQPRS